MPLDQKAAQFLGTSKVAKLPGMESKEAQGRFNDFREKEFVAKAGHFYEELMAFFIDQKRKQDVLDDHAIGAVALFTINLREAYGSPQGPDEAKNWSDDKRREKLEIFDKICEQMQAYYDANR